MRRIVLWAGALSCLANLSFAQASQLGAAITPIAVVSLVVTGLFIVVSVLAWGALLASFSARRALFVVLLSNGLSFGIQALLNTFSATALLYGLVACPLITVLCWKACGPLRPMAWEPLLPTLHRLPWRTLGLVFGLICFEGVFSSMLFSRHEGWSRETLGMTLWLCGALCLVLTALLARKRTAQSALAVTLPLLLALYMAALLVTVVFPNSPILVAERTMVAIGTGLRLYLWLLLTYECCAQEAPPLPTFLVYCVLVLSIPHASLFSLSLRLHGEGVELSDIWDPSTFVSLAAIALFVVAIIAMAATTKRGQATPQANPSRGKDLDALAREARLSEREGQVLELLARGFTAKVAAQKLGLAESTVVTHTTHIYRKLGIGSRQELLQLVDGCNND